MARGTAETCTTRTRKNSSSASRPSYEGHGAVFGDIDRRMQPLDDWAVEVRAVMGNDDMVVAAVDLVAARGPHRVACVAAHAFRFDAGGRIAEAWSFVDDQAGWTRCSVLDAGCRPWKAAERWCPGRS